ncbi:MAG: amidase [Pirellulales bacterium]
MPQPGCLEIASAVQTHQRTAREVTDQAIELAERLQAAQPSFITLAADVARRQAEQVDRKLADGARLPLAGVPFAVKDLIDVAGLPTTCGSKVFANAVAGSDATVVERLVAAGAVLMGKLNLHECAFGFTGENAHYGNVKNPWDATRVAGGSSSGSAAAVAHGICPFTLGSDTGGSIRLPAALCGLVGLKPTYGRVSRAGGVPLSWTMDHVGPLTHTAAEAAVVLSVMAGRDEADESTSRRAVPDYAQRLGGTIEGLRIGVPRRWFFEDLSDEVAEAVEAALVRLKDLGASTVDVELPYLPEVVAAHRAIIFAEASSYYQPYLGPPGSSEREAVDFGADIRPLLLAGQFISAVDYLKAQRARRVIRSAWSKVFAGVDCLATPTSPVVATRFGQQTASLSGKEKPLVRAYLDLTLPFNFSGHPALSVPCGFAGNLPIGLQLVGKPFAEATILGVAHQYQQATDWHTRRPGVSQS